MPRRLTPRQLEIREAQARLQAEQAAARRERRILAQRVAQARRQLAALLVCDHCRQAQGMLFPPSQLNPEEVICGGCSQRRLVRRKQEARIAAFTAAGRDPVTGKLLPKEARAAN